MPDMGKRYVLPGITGISGMNGPPVTPGMTGKPELL